MNTYQKLKRHLPFIGIIILLNLASALPTYGTEGEKSRSGGGIISSTEKTNKDALASFLVSNTTWSTEKHLGFEANGAMVSGSVGGTSTGSTGGTSTGSTGGTSTGSTGGTSTGSGGGVFCGGSGQPPAVSAAITVSTPSCDGNLNRSITAVASNGTAPFTYQWDNTDTAASRTVTTAGTFNVTITDASGCTDVATKTLGNNLPNSSSISITACGSYSWAQNSMTYTSSGRYIDTLQNQDGCDSIITLNLTINPFPEVSILGGDTMSFCSPDSIVLYAEGNANVFRWFKEEDEDWNYIGNDRFAVQSEKYIDHITDKNGVRYVAFGESLNGKKATVMKYDGLNWVTVGNAGFSQGASFFHDLAVHNGELYIAYTEGPSSSITVKKFDGMSWNTVGNSQFGDSNNSHLILEIDSSGTPFVAFSNFNAGRKLSVMKLDSLNWAYVGSQVISAASVEFFDLFVNGSTPYVAFENALGQPSVMTFDGVNWVSLGQINNASGYLDLEIHGSEIYLAYKESIAATVRKYDGTNWILVGPRGFSGSLQEDFNSTFSFKIIEGVPYFASQLNFRNNLNVKKFNGSGWVLVGRENFSGFSSDFPVLSFHDGTINVAFREGITGNPSISVMQIREEPISTSPSVSVGSEGNYYFQAISAEGCTSNSDTITVVENGTTTVNQYDTANGSYTWSRTGITYDTSGIYSFTKTDTTTCDSLFQLYLTIDGLLTATISDTACGSYLWAQNGMTYTSSGNYSDTVQNNSGADSLVITLNLTINDAPLITISSQTDISCNNGTDGSFTAMSSGGTGRIAYLWSNGDTSATAFNLGAGVYTVTATDANGCTASLTDTITEPTALGNTLSSFRNVSCNGAADGFINFAERGGTSPYKYLWSNGDSTANITGLAAGVYTISVTDANNCGPITRTITIGQPSALSMRIVFQKNVSCNGGNDGRFRALANGGTGSISYLWSNGETFHTADSLSAGVYSVTATDANGCAATLTDTIGQPAAMNVTISTQTDVSCNGGNDGSFTAVASGGTGGITYQWSNSDTSATAFNLSAGVYTVTATDANGCTATLTDTIGQPAAMNVIISAQTDVSCNGGNDGSFTAVASGGTGGITYQWSNSDTSATAFNLSAGVYTVTATDANGCTATLTDTIGQPVAMNVTISAQTDVSCNGGTDGSFTAMASGGTGGITYQWSNSDTSATAFNLSAGVYTVTATDANGCAVTLTDTIGQPAAMNVIFSAQTDVSCNGGNDGSFTAVASGGTGGITYQWSNSDTSATAFNLSAGVYTVTVTDANGCTATLTDTIGQPVAIVLSALVNRNASCQGTPDGSASTSVNGGTLPYSYIWSNSDTSAMLNNVSEGVYALTVTDANGCSDTTSVTISVIDTIKPTVVTQNITVYLDASGTVSITAADVDNGSTDICGTPTLSLDVSSFTCNEVGANTVNLTATDVNSNVATATATVTVLDTIKPTVITQNITAYLDASGTVSITTADVDNGSTDICGTPTLSLDVSSFTCNEVGANTVNLTATDVNSNVATATATVTVLDTVKPTVVTQNITVYLDASGTVSITTADVDNGSTDICGTPTLSLDVSSFTCSEVGANTVNLTTTDVNSNVASATAIVTVLDTIKPTVITQNITAYLDASGTVSITTADVDNGSTDICGAPTLSLDVSSFTCSEVGANTVNLTATDVNSNVASATAIVTVLDTIRPTVITQNITAYLDASGTVSITAADVDNGSTDICGTPTLSLDVSSFTCNEVGANTVNLTATDVNSNVATATATVTVLDTIKPTVITQNITAYLDASGTVSITTADVDNGSTDICGAPTLSLDVSSFTCNEVGANTVNLTATDVNSNVATATATVTVLDTVKPTVITQNITAYLDASGTVSITAADVDNGSTDICGTPTLSLDVSSFTCNEVGANTVNLTATDVNSNVATATATVTVLDTIKPTVITQNITAYLDASGTVSITTADVDNGSTDICGAPTLSLDVSSFTCSEVGANTVNLTATDVNSNVASATAIVTVLDTIKPTVITQNITAYLDASGTVSITTADVDNGSTDICGAPTLSLDVSSFTCSEVGANTVYLIATDSNGNMDSTTATVTVLDTIKPTVVTQNITVYLDASGTVSITTADVDNGSTDICGTPTLSLDVSSFSCSEEGTNTVYLIATDSNGNIDSTTAIVTVFDTIRPLIANCISPINQMIDAGSCSAIVSWSAPTASDNCLVDSLVASHQPGDVFALGTTVVTYIAYDPSLNTDTCSFTVTVFDSEDPSISGIPSDIIVSNDTLNCNAIVNWTEPIATDNCTLDSLRSNFQSGASFPIGKTTVIYTAYDAAMNIKVDSFTVTVNDTELPTIVCPSDIAQCDSIVTFVSATGTDNCVTANISRTDVTGLNSGDQFPVGITTLSYQVTDASNNQASCSVNIEVYAPAVANAGPDLETRDIEPVQFESKAINAASINWTPFMSLVDGTVEKAIANPQVSTTYQMEVISPDGCTDSDEVEITVTVVEELDVTTLFSPNGDGMNDTWVVNKPALIEGCQLVIFNRNGTEVYSTNQYNNEWDGTISGKQLPEGTYYFVFDCNDGRTMNGPITILRERR